MAYVSKYTKYTCMYYKTTSFKKLLFAKYTE